MIVVFYFFLGLLLQLPSLAVELFLINSGYQPASVAALTATLVIPWCLKPVYGIISDTCPIGGKRRKPYIILFNGIAALAWLLLGLAEQSMLVTQVALFIASLATCFSDVMYDSIVVTLAKKEDDSSHGKLQSRCWGARAGGALLGAILGGVLLKYVSPGDIFLTEAFVCLCTSLTAACFIKEESYNKYGSQGCMTQICDLVGALKVDRLWKPAIFVFVFASTPSSSSAFLYYLVTELKFSTTFLGFLTCVNHGSMLIGTAIYSHYLRNVPFRKFFTILVIVSAVLGATPIILVTHINAQVGVPDGLFTAGDDLFLSVIGQIALMPVLILAAKLCPPGIEASLYASFVSVLNFAGIVSEYSGAGLTHFLNISKEDFSHLPTLIAICTTSSLLPLLFISLLPKGNVKDIVHRENENENEKEKETFIELSEMDEVDADSDSVVTDEGAFGDDEYQSDSIEELDVDVDVDVDDISATV